MTVVRERIATSLKSPPEPSGGTRGSPEKRARKVGLAGSFHELQGARPRLGRGGDEVQEETGRAWCMGLGLAATL